MIQKERACAHINLIDFPGRDDIASLGIRAGPGGRLTGVFRLDQGQVQDRNRTGAGEGDLGPETRCAAKQRRKKRSFVTYNLPSVSTNTCKRGHFRNKNPKSVGYLSFEMVGQEQDVVRGALFLPLFRFPVAPGTHERLLLLPPKSSPVQHHWVCDLTVLPPKLVDAYPGTRLA